MNHWEEAALADGVDIEEVTRCKDCKHAKTYYHGEQSKLGMFTYYCLMGGYHVQENEYCSKAEVRKKE